MLYISFLSCCILQGAREDPLNFVTRPLFSSSVASPVWREGPKVSRSNYFEFLTKGSCSSKVLITKYIVYCLFYLHRICERERDLWNYNIPFPHFAQAITIIYTRISQKWRQLIQSQCRGQRILSSDMSLLLIVLQNNALNKLETDTAKYMTHDQVDISFVLPVTYTDVH